MDSSIWAEKVGLSDTLTGKPATDGDGLHACATPERKATQGSCLPTETLGIFQRGFQLPGG